MSLYYCIPSASLPLMQVAAPEYNPFAGPVDLIGDEIAACLHGLPVDQLGEWYKARDFPQPELLACCAEPWARLVRHYEAQPAPGLNATLAAEAALAGVVMSLLMDAGPDAEVAA